MKPSRLKMYGVGPYAQEIEIDFTDLNNEGLFLITGATGAGKTSIFDGITYALYGETNDKSRKDGIICDYLDVQDHKNTYVEFVFELNNTEYTVRRVPKHWRYKSNGERNATVTNESVVLEFESESYTNTEATSYIKDELIGLDGSQFKQIIMLAQGSFSKFIKADSNERSKVLDQIFDSSIYMKITESLKWKKDTIDTTIKDERKNIFASLKQVNTENDEYNSLIKDEVIAFDKIKELLISEKNKIGLKLEEHTKKIEELKIDELKGKIISSKTENEGIETLLKSEKELIELLEYYDDITKKKKLLENHKKAMTINGEYSTLQSGKENRNQLSNKIKESKKTLIELKETNEELIEKEEETKTLRDSTTERFTKLISLEDDVNKVIESIKEMKVKEMKAKDLNTKNIEDQKNIEEVLTLEIDELKNKITILANEIEKREPLIDEINQVKNTEKSLKLLVKEIKVLEKKQKEVTTKEENVKTLKTHTDQSLKEYSDLNNLWIANEAYKLSTKLTDGSECPVCGSNEHPKKAIKPEGVPSNEEIEKSRNHYDKTKETYNTENGIYTTLKGDLANRNNDIISKANELNIDIEKAKGEEKKIKARKVQLENELKTLATSEKVEEIRELKVKKIEEKQNFKDKITNRNKEIEILKTEIDNINASKEDVIVKLGILSTTIDTFQGELNEKRNQKIELESQIKNIIKVKEEISNQNTMIDTTTKLLNIANEKLIKYQEHWDRSRTNSGFEEDNSYLEASKIDGNILEEEIKKYEDKKTKLETIVSQNDKYKGKEIVDIKGLEKELEEINNVKTEISKEINTANTRIEIISSAKKNLDKKRRDIEDRENEYQVYDKLYKISEGKYGDKKNNVSFQNYVLGVYFQDVLERANTRLSIMSNNQYKIVLDASKRKGSGKSGLELNVFDAHTGRERSIKTLSGGETFKASMALALGLSDVVQEQSGGIKLDSVFIDEGFGTLDEESLEVAMDILMGLKDSGRTVGIISHVRELKQTLPTQIVVTKGLKGSNVEVIS